MRDFARQHPGQLARSWYVAFFQLPALPERMLCAGNYAWLSRSLVNSILSGTFTPEDLSTYRQAWSQPGAVTAMLNWYRAVRLQRPPATPRRVRVPVQILWGDGDAFLDRRLAEAGADECDRYQVSHLRSASHWVQHEEPAEVNRMLCDFADPGLEARAARE